MKQTMVIFVGLLFIAVLSWLAFSWTGGLEKPVAEKNGVIAPAPPKEPHPKRPLPHSSQGSVSPSGVFIPKNLGAEIAPSKAEAAVQTIRDGLPTEPDAEGVIHWDGLRIDTRQKSISLPATVNQTEGIVEYALVHENGKVHEALFSTKVPPRRLQAALLLLGAKSAPLGSGAAAGSELHIRVQWETNGPLADHDLESMIVTSADQRGKTTEPYATGAWFFNGSIITTSGFAADLSGSIISLVVDPVAIVNDRSMERPNGLHRLPHAALLPKKGQPVRFLFRL